MKIWQTRECVFSSKGQSGHVYRGLGFRARAYTKNTWEGYCEPFQPQIWETDLQGAQDRGQVTNNLGLL